MKLMNLPNEILLHIASYLGKELDINAFSQVCRHLHSLLDRTLYQHNVRYSDSTALLWAARQGRVETATKVLDACCQRQATINDREHPSAVKAIMGTSVSGSACTRLGREDITNRLPHITIRSVDDNGQPSTPLMACINSRTIDLGQTALSIAAECGYLKFAELLIEAQCDIEALDRNDHSPLFHAICNKHISLAKCLLLAGADLHAQAFPEESLICCAARCGHLASLKLLREYGAFSKLEPTPVLRLLPLQVAVSGKHYEVAEFLRGALELDALIELESENVRALLISIAAACGWEDFVHRLLILECPVDVIAQDEAISWPSKRVYPLCRAAANGHYRVVQLLLKWDASPNPPPGHRAEMGPLFWAIQGGYTMIVELLLDNGANPNTPDSHGESMLALSLPHAAIFRLLVWRGAHVIDRRIVICMRILALSTCSVLSYYLFMV
ncbi:hypothetical protein N7539_008719 [Penicillium diatomitis]|uniref:F-box domain-containing protein n=1 Tax=Penicillium diatomitis TaxID=2819901 RepID=A0A9W9WR47_9EURO|nr:uncharacterized protein N7539_008719 [Penicillium diatomitis]KAJ5472150.1 hypothetical protein N7539_008719 [Penicillium diatomitis]